ncbi:MULTISPECIES: hypothetical protein [unclassified Lysobacter]
MSKPRCLAAICVTLLLAACNLQAPVDATAPVTETRADAAVEPPGGAVSDATIAVPVAPERTSERVETDWQPMALTAGEAWISCDSDYADGEGQPLLSLGYSVMRRSLARCSDPGLLRLRYQGKISGEFTALIERVVELADTLGIDKRILDIDSTGGQIEQAIRVGDLIGGSGWTVWVREDAVCHSSCVLVLAAGDMRMIAGKVGIHRMIRIGSKATSRAELQQELEEVHAQVREYLQRNGVAFAVADLMMTVPNRRLRLLTDDELDLYGLNGLNAVEDDLQRIQLTRQCGEAFVQRKDAFYRAFERECQAPGGEVGVMGECAQQLRHRFGFPDSECPTQSPLSEYDSALEMPDGVLNGNPTS